MWFISCGLHLQDIYLPYSLFYNTFSIIFTEFDDAVSNNISYRERVFFFLFKLASEIPNKSIID